MNDEVEGRLRKETAELQELNGSLLEANELFRLTLASIGDAVITTDIEGAVVYLNPIAERLTDSVNSGALVWTMRRDTPWAGLFPWSDRQQNCRA